MNKTRDNQHEKKKQTEKESYCNILNIILYTHSRTN